MSKHERERERESERDREREEAKRTDHNHQGLVSKCPYVIFQPAEIGEVSCFSALCKTLRPSPQRACQSDNDNLATLNQLESVKARWTYSLSRITNTYDEVGCETQGLPQDVHRDVNNLRQLSTCAGFSGTLALQPLECVIGSAANFACTPSGIKAQSSGALVGSHKSTKAIFFTFGGA